MKVQIVQAYTKLGPEDEGCIFLLDYRFFFFASFFPDIVFRTLRCINKFVLVGDECQ